MSKRMIAAVAATTVAAGLAMTQAALAQEIKVGVILPYTGVGAELAQQIERGAQLSANEFGESLHGGQERLPRRMPRRAVVSDAAAGDKAVHVRVVVQLLGPGVQDGEKTQLRPEMAWVRRQGKQSVGDGTEQQAIHQLRVLEGQGNQFVRQREDDMRVGHRQ